MILVHSIRTNQDGGPPFLVLHLVANIGTETCLLMHVASMLTSALVGSEASLPRTPSCCLPAPAVSCFSCVINASSSKYNEAPALSSLRGNSFNHWTSLASFLFAEKYDYIGKLLKPGEEPTEYSDTEEEQSSHEKSKNDWDWTFQNANK